MIRFYGYFDEKYWRLNLIISDDFYNILKKNKIKGIESEVQISDEVIEWYNDSEKKLLIELKIGLLLLIQLRLLNQSVNIFITQLYKNKVDIV